MKQKPKIKAKIKSFNTKPLQHNLSLSFPLKINSIYPNEHSLCPHLSLNPLSGNSLY